MKVFIEIRKIVKRIPPGKVTTYGIIAEHLGLKDNRLVGWAVYKNSNPLIPCHRVVKKDGQLAESFSLGGWEEQKRRLQKEGVGFSAERGVDLNRCLWRPGLRRSSLKHSPDKKID